MNAEVLSPSMDLLRKEYVLVQAWKKTANFIRYHNWYADTLKLDWTTVNLPEFIAEIAESLETPQQWQSDPLRIVPAPKRQRWHVSPKSGEWEPIKKGVGGTPLRPLAHVSLRDQVVATAIMLCLANRAETRQGDPRNSLRGTGSRKEVSSYGNRLFCETVDGELRHRWGSAKLFRSYFQDYRSFISRPAMVADSIERRHGQRVFIIESDLKQFYDRVRPERLMAALRSIEQVGRESDFFDFAESVLNWQWHIRDASDIAAYANQTDIDDFTRVALPQGLVSAGFFANVVLLAFDERLRNNIGNEVTPGIFLKDACRYVDDLRIVVSTNLAADSCQQAVAQWLQLLLDDEAPGLRLSKDKTKAAELGGSQRPLVRQSIRMERIQSEVSGGFDAMQGQAILDAIRGLMRSQQAWSSEPTESSWAFSPLPDVRDETVARFSAARFRTTFRSIRPLLEHAVPSSGAEETKSESERTRTIEMAWNQQDLDEDARAFALSLIQEWVKDPSNVRLLRIGLDIWPDPKVLREILNLLRPFMEPGGRRKAPRRVAWYCLSQLLRAGSTETGLVEDAEHLPADVDLQQYREILRDEASNLITLPAARIPWYLRQQALLFLACFDPSAAPIVRAGQSAETKDYRRLILFLRGEHTHLKSRDFASLAVLTRRAFSDHSKSADLVRWNLTVARKREISLRDPSFARELSEIDRNFFDDLPARIREDLSFEADAVGTDLRSLTETVSREGPAGPLRNELSLLRFAAALLGKLQQSDVPKFEVITPRQVRLELKIDSGIAEVVSLDVSVRRTDASGSLYCPPSWCKASDRWRIQLGYLLRFILIRQLDFTCFVQPDYWKERTAAYRPVRSHWFQRIYGLFSGQKAFGGDWLPITDWMERFLLALLRWPGCRTPDTFEWIQCGIAKAEAEIKKRIKFLEDKRGRATRSLFLPMTVKWPTQQKCLRSLRACVVQSIVPENVEESDLTFSKPEIRRRHRSHLSAVLATVNRMLDLRGTHMADDDRRLDWLILPELAVHPRDVRTHLIPFARAHRTLILAGLTYEELFRDEPLVNSALWIMPNWSEDQGLQIETRRQGKRHLAPNEQSLCGGSRDLLQGFRPCQWLVGYPWSDANRPLWLTASVCYDATDLRLVADLRNESDVFAIPAFNKDIKTFNQMALALHYHMFQLVVVANNGLYGGSNAYWPVHGEFQRQIFHLHGQPQASVAFLEIEDIADFLAHRDDAVQDESSRVQKLKWKHPPAGLTGSGN